MSLVIKMTPEIRAEFDEDVRYLKSVRELTEKMKAMTPEQIAHIYWNSDNTVRYNVLLQWQTPYSVIKDALFNGTSLLTKTAIYHFSVLDEDLSVLAESHKYESVRECASVVLEKRRSVGYFGPEDFCFSIPNPKTGKTIADSLFGIKTKPRNYN